MTLLRSLIVFLLLLVTPFVCADELADALRMAHSDDGCLADGEGADLIREDFLKSREAKIVEAHDRSLIAQAQQKERSGDIYAAYGIYDQISSCRYYWKNNGHEDYELGNRLLQKLGEDNEKKGRLQQAFDWYRHNEDRFIKDLERVMMKMVKAKPADLGTIGTAFNFFERHQLTDSLNAVRALALQNAKQSLADEDKQFQSKQSEQYGKAYRSLEQAQKWLEFVEALENRAAVERAEKRGDSLASQTTPYYLKETIKYYNFAKKPSKIKTIQGNAKKLGDDAKGRGETYLAVEYYEIAGLREQAGSLKKATEAKEEKDEGQRQKQFKKDRDKLEDELGL